MSDLLEHLSKDTLPESLLREFMDWCVWEQARPALAIILRKTGLDNHADAIAHVTDLIRFSQASEAAAKSAAEARRQTGPLGLSSAEAAAFLAHKIANAAMDENFDAEEVAFFAAQVSGWRGFADTDFTDPTRKPITEAEARKEQEVKLRALWEAHGSGSSES